MRLARAPAATRRRRSERRRRKKRDTGACNQDESTARTVYREGYSTEFFKSLSASCSILVGSVLCVGCACSILVLIGGGAAAGADLVCVAWCGGFAACGAIGGGACCCGSACGT